MQAKHSYSKLQLQPGKKKKTEKTYIGICLTGCNRPRCQKHHVSLTHFFLHSLDENVHCNLALAKVIRSDPQCAQPRCVLKLTYNLTGLKVLSFIFWNSCCGKVAIERILQSKADLLNTTAWPCQSGTEEDSKASA